MNAVMDIALPIFGLGLLGYGAARFGLFSESAADGLARFVFDFALPITLVRIFSHAALPADMPWGLLGSFYIPVYAMYVLGLFLAGRLFGHGLMERVIAALGGAFGNLALLGLPLVLRVFGEAGAVPFFIVLSLHAIGFYAITTVLLEYGRNRAGSPADLLPRMVKGLFTNPFILALAAGLLLNRTGTALPGPVDQMALYLQRAVEPCALFSLGASLARYRIAGEIREPLLLVSMKNIVLPLGVFLFARFIFDLSTLWTMVVVMMAAQPAGVTMYLFAERYGVARPLATTTVFLSSVTGVVTLTLLIWVYQVAGIPGQK